MNLFTIYFIRLILKLISQCIKSDFRTLARLQKKFSLNKLHLEFDEICMKEDLLPKLFAHKHTYYAIILIDSAGKNCV